MKTAVLPFNAGPKTDPAYARQTAGFVAEVARQVTGQEINPVSYMGRANDGGGIPRFTHINPSESLNVFAWWDAKSAPFAGGRLSATA